VHCNDEYESNEVAIVSVYIVHVIRIEVEKYFEDAVAQRGTIAECVLLRHYYFKK